MEPNRICLSTRTEEETLALLNSGKYPQWEEGYRQELAYIRTFNFHPKDYADGK